MNLDLLKLSISGRGRCEGVYTYLGKQNIQMRKEENYTGFIIFFSGYPKPLKKH